MEQNNKPWLNESTLLPATLPVKRTGYIKGLAKRRFSIKEFLITWTPIFFLVLLFSLSLTLLISIYR